MDRRDAAFLIVFFLGTAGGAIIGISMWIVMPAVIALACVAVSIFPPEGKTAGKPPSAPAPDPDAASRDVLDHYVAVNRLAEEFATALVNGDFSRAHSMLIQDLQDIVTCERLKDGFYAMFGERIEGEPTGIRCFVREDWRSVPPERPTHPAAGFCPPRESHRYRGVYGPRGYVGAYREDSIQSVTVTVAKVEDEYRISSIERGRP